MRSKRYPAPALRAQRFVPLALLCSCAPWNAHAFAPPFAARSSPKPLSLTANHPDRSLANHRSSMKGFKTVVPQASGSRRTASPPTALAVGSALTLMDPVVLRAGLGATAKLLSSIALGGVAATKRFNILDASAISALSRLTYWIFQPAFLLCSVSSTFVNASKSSAGLPGQILALMPLIAALQIAMGAIVGRIVCRLARVDSESEASQVQMCTTFGNSGPLPLIFSEALFAGKSMALFRDVAACISFYLLVWSPLFWSVGRIILGTYNSGGSGSSSDGINGLAAVPIWNKVMEEVKKFLSPPVIGSILGVLIGTIPFLRSIFFGGFGTPLFGAIATLGTAYLPAALLVLAGSLVGTNKPKESSTAAATTTTESSSERSIPSGKSIAAIFFSRFLVAPSLSFLALNCLSHLGLLGAANTRARAIVSFCILAEGCMPPAQNSVIMLQLEGLKERASSMAKLLTIVYAMAVVPVTVLLSFCLTTSGILAFQ